MRASRIAESFVGAFLNDLVRSLVRRYGRQVLGVLALLALGAISLFVRWWQAQSTFTHLLVIGALLGLAVAWSQHRWTHRARPKPVGDEAEQVLYRWFEPDDLPLEERVCYCGKERVPGELVYIGITGAHRSRELDDDRRASCWWREGLVGKTQVYSTRDAVERAERRAIRSENPRENKQHARGRT